MKLSPILKVRAILLGIISISSLYFTSCASNPIPNILSREGSKFNQDLSRAIQAADKIEIIEHSFWRDFNETDVERNQAPTYIYDSKVLSAADKAYFAQQVGGLSNAKKIVFAACSFESHHTINFYKAGNKTSSLEVCFKCGDIAWVNGPQHIPSKDLFNALNAIVKKVGLSPSANWTERATIRYQAEKEKEGPPVDDIPVGKPVPGKPGFLFNPYTQNHVDVEGIPSGTKVRDPQDPKGRIFRVP